MKYVKSAIALATYPAILFLGLIAGAYVGDSVLHGRQGGGDPLDPDFERARLERTLESKDETIRARALTAHLEYLNRIEGRDQAKFPAYVASEKALTLARLSAISRRLGDNAQSDALLGKATSFCSVMEWKRCDGDKLLLAAARMDRGAVDEVFSQKP